MNKQREAEVKALKAEHDKKMAASIIGKIAKKFYEDTQLEDDAAAMHAASMHHVAVTRFIAPLLKSGTITLAELHALAAPASEAIGKPDGGMAFVSIVAMTLGYKVEFGGEHGAAVQAAWDAATGQ